MDDEVVLAPMRGRAPGGSAQSATPFAQPLVLRNGVGRAALGFGLSALVLCVMPGVGLAVSVTAVILGVVGVRRAKRLEASNRGQAQFGLFSGAVAGVVAIAATIAVIVLWPQVSQLRQCIDDATTDTDQSQCTDEFRHAIDARFK